jgi:hypothetical protein
VTEAIGMVASVGEADGQHVVTIANRRGEMIAFPLKNVVAAKSFPDARDIDGSVKRPL